MKKFFFIGTFLFSLALFSCTKNDDFDENAISDGNLLTDSIGGCKKIIIHGSYQKDTVLTEDNYLDVSVNVRNVGNYTIETNTVNGMVFKGTGRLGKAGGNTVRLYGTGKPITNGLFPYEVRYGGSICYANIGVGSGATGLAVFSLGGAPNNCAGVIKNGTYKAGQILVGNNTVIMNVNVTALGFYTLNIPTVNDVTFTCSGLFTSLGVQSVTLQASGTPAASGTFNFAVNNTTTNCSFDLVFL